MAESGFIIHPGEYPGTALQQGDSIEVTRRGKVMQVETDRSGRVAKVSYEVGDLNGTGGRKFYVDFPLYEDSEVQVTRQLTPTMVLAKELHQAYFVRKGGVGWDYLTDEDKHTWYVLADQALAFTRERE